ncbi:MAG: hypothetical protein PHD10_00020 [Bacilli bacterium]|nr:hypothetical protein [Bacilli bacterium]
MKKKKRITIMIMVFLIIWITFIITDFSLAKNNRKPIFAIPVFRLKDGGTIEYYGLGYKVIKYNVLDNHETGQISRKAAVFGFWTLKYKN